MSSALEPSAPAPSGRRRLRAALLRWFDAHAGAAPSECAQREIDWLRLVPFAALHLGCLGVLWVGWSPFALGMAVFLYVMRMFAITAFYHRYFSHRSFQTGRLAQFAFAVLGNSAVQRGPLWWAAHHRQHHLDPDGDRDPHSPVRGGFWWSHMGWFGSKGHFATRMERVRDLALFPELRFLDRFDALVPALLFAALFGLGRWLEVRAPGLGTSGAQLLVWGLISTVVLAHATFTINSLAHVWGTRRFETPDGSRNNALLALITLGEGWHNNHHRYPRSARQGFRPWELDPSYWGLKVLERTGIVWNLQPVPAHLERSDRPLRDAA